LKSFEKTGVRLSLDQSWQGDPRVKIQDDKGMAKAFQVRQVLKAIERLEVKEDEE
jgi:hypothetical protein